MIPCEVRISVPCRLEKLAVVAGEARRLAMLSVGSEAAGLVDLAVTEICSNVIRHGHAGRPQDTFTVHIKAIDGSIEIEVRDAGDSFDAATPVMPSVDVDLMDLPEGGFGLALVSQTMDVFEQRHDHGINITRLIKRRP